MTLTKRQKENTFKAVRIHEKDTGSPEVQVAILSRRIEELSSHLKKNRKDMHSRRGLIKMVADRRRHLRYLEKKNPKRHNTLVKSLGLK